MSRSDIEAVLANWIGEATAPTGQLAAGVDPARWAAGHFIAWWRSRIEDSLGSAEGAAANLRAELLRLNDGARLDAVLHEATHVEDALGDLRAGLGLSGPSKTDI